MLIRTLHLRFSLWRVGVVAGLLVLLAPVAAQGSVPPPPDYWFKEVGLPVDEASLIGYLTEGLPATLPGGRAADAARLPMERWRRYEDVVLLLEDTPDANAALRRILDAPLPDRLVDDLLYASFRRWDSWDSFEEWDRLAAAQSIEFRLHCLTQLDFHQDSEAEALRLIAALRPRVEESLSDRRIGGTLAGYYGSLCVRLASKGLLEGVDGLISLLPLAREAYGGDNILFYLQQIAGPQVPISQDMPEAEFREAVRHWQEWWAAHRASFKPYVHPARAPEEKHYTYPPPKGSGKRAELLGYLGGSMELAGHSDIVDPAHPEAEKWLEKHARHYKKQLREAADNATLPDALRWAAARWYVKTGGTRAAKWVEEKVKEWEPGKAKGGRASVYGPDSLLGMVRSETRSSKTVTGIAQACVEARCPATPYAVGTLFSEGKGLGGPELVLEQYEDLVGRFPEIRVRAAEHFLKNPAPGDEKVFVDVLRSGERKAAQYVVAAVQGRGLADALPAEARAQFESWAKDPEVRMAVISAIEDPALREEAVLQLVGEAEGTDAQAARIYAFGYLQLTRYGNRAITPKAQFCLDALGRCIAAYRASRAANPPWEL